MGILERFALDGGVAVVTGAGRGIGEGIAIGLAEAGCDVVLTARRENEIEAVADKVRALGRRALAIPGDITDGDFVDQLADRSKQEMGKVTLWVSNAGGADDRTPRHLADMPDRQWDYQMDLNLRAVFTGARAARSSTSRRVPRSNRRRTTGRTPSPRPVSTA
jgi:7-alpha-hydroxysteroid dehydrogenase